MDAMSDPNIKLCATHLVILPYPELPIHDHIVMADDGIELPEVGARAFPMTKIYWLGSITPLLSWPLTPYHWFRVIEAKLFT
jgi:hypothetical protein